MTPLTEIAWAAGFFDGEGSTSGQLGGGKDTRLRLRARVVNTDLGQLERLRGALDGIGAIYRNKRQKPHHKPQWTWHAYGASAETALEALWPFLGEAKRAQAEHALEAVRTQPPAMSRSEVNRARARRRQATQCEQLPGVAP